MRYPIKNCPLTFTPGLTKNNSHLLHSDWHHDPDSRMLCSPPSSCLVHPVDRFDSERWFSSDQVIFLAMFCVFFWQKNHAAFKWKDTILGFMFPQVVQKHWLGEVGKIKYVLISYFLGNICAKNCCSRTVYVKIIVSQRWDVFWDTM